MMSEKLSTRHFILAGLLILAAFSRLIPHPPNFTAVGAMALFGGAYVSSRTLAIILPLGALWVSDLILNNLVYTEYYQGFVLFSSGHIWIYISFIAIVLIGRFTMKNVTMKSVGLSGASASIIFFLLSNFGVWIGGLMYPLSLSGLISCYVAALPFFGWTLIGNAFYCTMLFGSFEFASNKISVLHAR
ncbi:MAG: hypothetical protein QF814_04105 [Candidatus Marinimicrobia bacterium]|jgi:hypothetical protein|nr:hypothetical protein [Candidatus Neomarinimicrobiota bacterium]HJM47639.1 DUF6580 family putative transport protein [Candidatus Neomarinimicrobiota bacterium]|tara:strand:- start:3528 stop:4091 length:564 start_codon:yes stop_codon:yes gene_type:complete